MKRLALFFILLSCQPIEIIEPVVFDNDQFSSISINAKNLENHKFFKRDVLYYHDKVKNVYVYYQLLLLYLQEKKPPRLRLKGWHANTVALPVSNQH